jgi:hypothetical protein
VKYIFFIFLLGCAQVTSLNLKKHQFGQKPEKIIWFQIPGLEEEHLSVIRFSNPSLSQKTSFEQMVCLGKFWTFNLYDLRPDSKNGTFSQLTGKKDITNSCEDYNHKPIWNYLLKPGYKAGIIERGLNPSSSLINQTGCEKEKSNFFQNSFIWIMDKKNTNNGKDFLIVDGIPFEQGVPFFEKTCQKSDCNHSLSSEAYSIYQALLKQSERLLLIVRDGSYQKALENKKTKEAVEILLELDKTIDFFTSVANKRSDVLVLVTSSDVKSAQFPLAGKQWSEFEKNGKNLAFNNKRLVGTSWAHGARAENFCGFYEESQVFERIMNGPEQQGLELKIINPFD